jgi:recombination protein RecT
MTEVTTQVAKQPSQKALAVKAFQGVMNNSYYQTLLQNTLQDNKGTFCTSLMELFSSDEKLMQCKPTDLMAEALKAASLHLPLNKQLGQAYILPFKNNKTNTMVPTLIVGTKGLLQLAMRTGKYETINADTVYEGELRRYDKVTGNLDLSGTRTSNTPVGYFAYFKMKSGLSKLLYMSIDEVCIYAKQYSPTVKFGKVTAEGLKKIAIEQAEKGSSEGVGWYSNFESMAIKTVLRRLLSKWGELSIESNNDILSMDESPNMPAEQQRDEEFAEVKEVVTVDAETGEVTHEQPSAAAQPKTKAFELE